MAGGILIGATMFGNPSGRDPMATAIARMREVLTYVNHDYVDTVDVEKLSQHAIEGMLERLDPHSAYVPASDLKMANSQLEGDFDGVGVEFVLIRDSIQVVSPLSGGPSDKAGIRPGDRIVKVNGEIVAGVNINTMGVFNRLRGPRGSAVALEVAREGEPKLLKFDIKRDKIPTRSIDASFMSEPGTGFIKISRFTASTDKEFRSAMSSLRKQGMQRLVLDLRDNPGGYLDKAIKVADEFLETGRMIVYTDGKGDKYDARYMATASGQFESEPLVILLNEGSASAAEILAGALQDNDRATIVGRRSFGKGLVQLPISLSDGGELRLTISRYYTPSGRCIQKPYDPADLSEYENDLTERFERGEYFHEDTALNGDTVRYHTLSGRTVYGGGGIKPDVFVPLDSTKNNGLMASLYNEYVIQAVATQYAERNGKLLRQMGMDKFRKDFKIPTWVEDRVKAKARMEGVKFQEADWAATEPSINAALRAYIGRTAYGENGFYSVALQKDEEYQQALHNFTTRRVVIR